VDVEWDAQKAATNYRKHGVDSADAATALHDDFAIVLPDETSSEDRFVTLGLDASARLLVVVYVWRNERVRIISARHATARERKKYEARR